MIKLNEVVPIFDTVTLNENWEWYGRQVKKFNSQDGSRSENGKDIKSVANLQLGLVDLW